jgi:hypothetical protein
MRQATHLYVGQIDYEYLDNVLYVSIGRPVLACLGVRLESGAGKLWTNFGRMDEGELKRYVTEREEYKRGEESQIQPWPAPHLGLSSLANRMDFCADGCIDTILGQRTC